VACNHFFMRACLQDYSRTVPGFIFGDFFRDSLQHEIKKTSNTTSHRLYSVSLRWFSIGSYWQLI